MNRSTYQRFSTGFGWGLVATAAMTSLMLLGIATGLSPMPKPIPVALMGKLFGGGLPKAALMVLGVVSHLAYGGVWGGVLARLSSPVTVGKGVVLALILWLGMQVVVLPFLGWGVFGSSLTPRIAVATLVLHLVYGITLGVLVDRNVGAEES